MGIKEGAFRNRYILWYIVCNSMALTRTIRQWHRSTLHMLVLKVK